MKVLVAGEVPLIIEIGNLCMDAGHDTHLLIVEDLDDVLASARIVEEAADASVVIEVQNESAEAKRALVSALARAMPADALLLTSALATSATQAAAWITHPERLVGFALIPPLNTPATIELAPAMQTDKSYLEQSEIFWRQLGQTSEIVSDGPGLVRARIISCLVNEAASAVFAGIATPEDIDTAMRLGTNYPQGPLTWADLIGIDTVLSVMNGLFEEWGEDRYRPSPLLRRMVLAGRLGRKSGRGFFTYEVENRIGKQ